MHHPICVTFSFYHAGEVVLIDASLREEQTREGEMIVTMNRHGEVCQLAKLGGVPVDAMLVLNCTTVALTKVKEITELISKKLQADATSRAVGGLIAELSAENER
jgi:exosome complex component RRP45